MQPKRFWTHILKAVLVLYIIGGFIYSIILAVTFGTSFWWIVPVGWIITFLSASGIGTVIEISENTAARLEAEYIQDDDSLQANDVSDVRITDDSFLPSSAAKRQINKNHNASNYEEDGWVCPQCGESNGYDDAKCSKCGWQA